MQPNNHDEPQILNCLLADYQALKTEISRRANLQRLAVAAYLAILGYILRAIADRQASVFLISTLWMATVAALLFFARENREIVHLNRLIRNILGPHVGRLVNADPALLFPSEINDGGLDGSRRSSLNCTFLGLIFLFAPLVATLFASPGGIIEIRTIFALELRSILSLVIVGAGALVTAWLFYYEVW